MNLTETDLLTQNTSMGGTSNYKSGLLICERKKIPPLKNDFFVSLVLVEWMIHSIGMKVGK